MTQPTPRPRPRPGPGTPAVTVAGQPQLELSRADRRRAAARVARRRRLRRAVHALAVGCVLGGIGTFAAAVVDKHGTQAAGGTPARSPSASAVGANLADPTAATAYLAAASSDVAAVTTYDYRNLDDALAAGLAVTTGAYRIAFQQALTGALAQTARNEHVVHTFDVLEIGIGSITAGGAQAKVLVFGRQVVVDDATGTSGATSPVTLCATIRRLGDRYLISDLVEGANAGLPPGGPDLPAAAEAARTEMIAALSYRRADFDTQVQRVLAGATANLRAQLARNADETKAAMSAGHYDQSATVSAVAVNKASADSVTLMFAAELTRTTDAGAATPAAPARYEMTVVRTSGGWLADNIRSVDSP